MSSRLVDNISPALLAELDQASASMAAMVLIRQDGETELVARDAVQDEYDAETERRRND